MLLLAMRYLNEMNQVQVESIINYKSGLHDGFHIHFKVTASLRALRNRSYMLAHTLVH